MYLVTIGYCIVARSLPQQPRVRYSLTSMPRSSNLASVVIDVAPLATAALFSPMTLLAYLLVAVIRPISVPAHSSQTYGAFSGLLELVPSTVTGGAQNCANSRPE